MQRKSSDTQVWVGFPDWIKDIENSDVKATIRALLFDWGAFGAEKIDNLKEYIATTFDDLNEEEVEEVARLLIEHGILKADSE